MVIKRVGVGSVAKISGVIYAAIGLILGFFMTIISAIGGMAAMAEAENVAGGLAGLIFGVGSIIIFPLLYGLMGFISGAIGALIYNLFAGIVGGIEIEVEGGQTAQPASYQAGAGF